MPLLSHFDFTILVGILLSLLESLYVRVPILSNLHLFPGEPMPLHYPQPIIGSSPYQQHFTAENGILTQRMNNYGYV